jgi:hypothetical protein
MAAGTVIVIIGRAQAAQQHARRPQQAGDALDQRFGLGSREVVQRQAGDDDARLGHGSRTSWRWKSPVGTRACALAIARGDRSIATTR